MSDLLQLAARCEQATGPVRELDALIAAACGLAVKRKPTYRRGHYIGGQPVQIGWKYDPPKVTASLDAAVALVPEGCREWHCGRNIKTGKGQAYLLDPATMRAPVYVHGETPALALCAAALKARARA